MTQQHTQRLEAKDLASAQEKKGILARISMPTVLAATLAAVTSFLFSSKLGLTGSLIGAALAAGVSALASQVYSAMIKDSVERIHDLTEQMQMLTSDDSAENASNLDKTLVRQAPLSMYEEDATSELDTTTISPELHDEMVRRHALRVMRRTFAVAAIAALLALAGYGIVVHLATNGQGIGPTSFEEVGVVASQTAPDNTSETEPTEEETVQDQELTQEDEHSEAATSEVTGTTGNQSQEQQDTSSDASQEVTQDAPAQDTATVAPEDGTTEAPVEQQEPGEGVEEAPVDAPNEG